MKEITILLSFSGDGGVEKMMINLLLGLISQKIKVDLLVIREQEPYFSRIPPEVNVIRLESSHTKSRRQALTRYLIENSPNVLLAAKHRALILAIQAKKKSGSNTRIIGQIHSHATASLKHKNWLKRLAWNAAMRKYYPRADKIISVSQGVADDIQVITGIPPKKLPVIYNPVITPELSNLAKKPADHPWLQNKTTPIILGAGRFTPQKDFLTLIHAFAKVQKIIPCRLIILGQGPLLGEYQQLVKDLGLSNEISLPGFTENPYSYMSRADLFVLSSAWEGFGLVLAEALALGTPACACNCDSGPSEILQDGQYGKLVPVGDIRSLADAIRQTLESPLDSNMLTQGAQRFTINYCTQRYLEELF